MVADVEHATGHRDETDQRHVGQKQGREMKRGIVRKMTPHENDDLSDDDQRDEDQRNPHEQRADEPAGRLVAAFLDAVGQHGNQRSRERSLAEQTPREVRNHEGDAKRGEKSGRAEDVPEETLASEPEQA